MYRRDTARVYPIGIKEVDQLLNKGTLFSESELLRIFSTKPIDVNELSTQMAEMNESIDTDLKEVDGNNKTIDNLLVSSDSKRLSTGKKAVKQRDSLTDIKDEIKEIASKVHLMSDAVKIASEYNQKLHTLQNGAEIQRLHAIADQINGYAESKQKMYVYKSVDETAKEDLSRKSTKEISTYGKDLGAQFYVLKGTQKHKLYEGQPNEREETLYICTRYDVAYCNYWASVGWGKSNKAWYNPFTWGDDNVRRLREKLQALEASFGTSFNLPNRSE